MSKSAPVDLPLQRLREMMVVAGVTQLLVKELAPNDNSKNQPYLAGSLDLINVLPIGPVREETTEKGNSRLKARFPLSWLRADGSLTVAFNSQLILYPQYPEIRLSGFLKGTEDGPNALMTIRQAGRLLFLGITSDRRIIGWVTAPDSGLAAEVRALGTLERTGVFQHIPIGTADTSRDRLLSKLREIHEKGWLPSQRLTRDGTPDVCKGSNCGGYTLEAQLGIIPNARAEPDFEGWEIKGHTVHDFVRFSGGPLTLMTPEPTGGYYRQHGLEAFVRKYGYLDKKGRPDRLNFGGVHRLGTQHSSTKMTLHFLGFDASSNKIIDPKGGFTLLDEVGNEAATWHFAGLIEHWNRKHAKAAYVPFLRRATPSQEYSYGGHVRLAENTDFLRFLTAMAAQKVYYDPGIKVEGVSSARPKTKGRSQFRIKSTEIGALYARVEQTTL